MLSWLQTTTESESLEHARARARERAEQAAEASYAPPSKDGLEVEEISAEEFLHLFQNSQDKAA